MKLTGRDAARFLAKPDRAAAGVLLHGVDGMRVALKRAALVEALIGPEGAAEMRLERIAAADLRREPALVLDALKATGFFAGARAVLVEDADRRASAAVIGRARRLAAGDARIVVTAGVLGAGSGLRKARGGAERAWRSAIYDDPPGRDEIEAALAAAGLGAPVREAIGGHRGATRHEVRRRGFGLEIGDAASAAITFWPSRRGGGPRRCPPPPRACRRRTSAAPSQRVLAHLVVDLLVAHVELGADAGAVSAATSFLGIVVGVRDDGRDHHLHRRQPHRHACRRSSRSSCR